MEKELEYLGRVLTSPDRPLVAILGGAKVSDKLEVIQNFLGRVDRLIIGGAMAYTFLKARGVPVGRSLVEDDKLDVGARDRGDGKGARPAARPAGRSRRDRRSSKRAHRAKRSTSATRRSAIAWASTSARRRSGYMRT